MIKVKGHHALRLLAVRRALTGREEQALSKACQRVLVDYRKAVLRGTPSRTLKNRARRALLHLGGDPLRASTSLKDYDHSRWGPFLGVSDEGSAARAIADAALKSPKVLALGKSARPTPLVIGLAVDAERLGGIGEVAVGPEEYADVWLDCVDRTLVTTNVGTRVNTRVYRREPRILLRSDSKKVLEQAKVSIAAAFRPFVNTPDRKPRPLTVFVDIPRFIQLTKPRKKAALAKLSAFVRSGEAAGKPRAPKGQALGLAAWVSRGLAGRDAAMAAIDLASSAKIEVVILDGVKRKSADAAISLAGLLDYFAPGIVGPLLREAKKRNVRLRAANLPDTDTIARSVWVGLTTARSMGAHLGKYGCFPLTRFEIDHVVEHVQRWFPNWSAAPVFFVDQGLLREGGVDVERDLPRGIEIWLETAASHGVRVVLIDTVDKATGRRLLKKSSADKLGYLGMRQIGRIERRARTLGINVLWAGGLDMRDTFEMGRLDVFGVYVTSAAATTMPVTGGYARDPGLAAMKEPAKDAVVRTKTLLEAGFLTSKLNRRAAEPIALAAEALLSALGSATPTDTSVLEEALSSRCVAGWRTYWTQLRRRSRK